MGCVCSKPSYGARGGPLRGLSVEYLKTEFLPAMGIDDSSDAKVYDIEPEIRAQSEQLCPRDNQQGAAFVDVALDPDAGRATVMLSYGWGYRVIDIVGALEAYCDRKGLDPREVRVWMCCLCINQHRVKEARERGDAAPPH